MRRLEELLNITEQEELDLQRLAPIELHAPSKQFDRSLSTMLLANVARKGVVLHVGRGPGWGGAEVREGGQGEERTAAHRNAVEEEDVQGGEER